MPVAGGAGFGVGGKSFHAALPLLQPLQSFVTLLLFVLSLVLPYIIGACGKFGRDWGKVEKWC